MRNDPSDKRKYISGAVAAAVCALYAAIVATDIFRAQIPFSGVLTLAGVVLCAVYAGVLLPRGRSARAVLPVLFAAVMTAAADVLLLFVPALYAVGVAIFCAAQTIRLSLFSGLSGRRAAILCAAQASLAGVLLLRGVPALYAAGTVYALLLLANLVCAFVCRAPRGIKMLRRTGMALFALCDICVALFNLLPAGTRLQRAAAALMWAFYLPSQLLLAREAGLCT
ncbi:MAG: hypothetical protein VB092_05285 [Oscillospiraceae bacterium]|nr:hypothetical protein [Oscillospiraceae bacterium]